MSLYSYLGKEVEPISHEVHAFALEEIARQVKFEKLEEAFL